MCVFIHTHTHTHMNHFTVCLKLTQYCESTRLQLPTKTKKSTAFKTLLNCSSETYIKLDPEIEGQLASDYNLYLLH